LKSQDPDGEEVKRKTPAGLFSWLLVEPLGRAIDGGRSANRLLIVIDGLDETVRDGRSELTEILRAEAQKLPAWIAVVVTSRPEEPIKRQFAGLQPVQIEAESADNRDDVRTYVREWLLTQNLAARHADALLGRIAAASEGNFLYLRMFREAVAKKMLRFDAPEGLPHGLVGLYESWFRRSFPDRKAYESYVPVLEVIAAAKHPVPQRRGCPGCSAGRRAMRRECWKASPACSSAARQGSPRFTRACAIGWSIPTRPARTSS
jgi:hypothetical protein